MYVVIKRKCKELWHWHKVIFIHVKHWNECAEKLPHVTSLFVWHSVVRSAKFTCSHFSGPWVKWTLRLQGTGRSQKNGRHFHSYDSSLLTPPAAFRHLIPSLWLQWYVNGWLSTSITFGSLQFTSSCLQWNRHYRSLPDLHFQTHCAFCKYQHSFVKTMDLIFAYWSLFGPCILTQVHVPAYADKALDLI